MLNLYTGTGRFTGWSLVAALVLVWASHGILRAHPQLTRAQLRTPPVQGAPLCSGRTPLFITLDTL